MSYILDALRKSESDRYQEKLPELGGQAPLWMKKKGRRSIWPALIVAALLINALVAGVLLWYRQPPVADLNASVAKVSPSPEAVLETTAGKNTQVDIVTRLEPEFEPQPGTEFDPEPETEFEPGTELEPETGTTIETQTEAAATGVVTGFVRKPLVADSFGAESGSVTLQEEAFEDEVISPQDAGESSVVEADSTADSSSRLAGIPLIDDLSREEKSRIPALKFSSHIYSSASDARRIVINQRYLREGQSVQGLRVVEITEEGVVLSLSGQVFQIPVLRDWSPDGS